MALRWNGIRQVMRWNFAASLSAGSVWADALRLIAAKDVTSSKEVASIRVVLSLVGQYRR